MRVQLHALRLRGWWMITLAVTAAIGVVVVAALVIPGGTEPASSSGDSVDRVRAASEILAIAPEAQKPALADGVVARDEVINAQEQAARCIEAIGFTRRETFSAKGERLASYEWSAPPGIGRDDLKDLGEAHERLAACNAEYFDNVKMLWDVQHFPTTGQVVDMYSWLESCLSGSEPMDVVEVASFNIYPTAPSDVSLKVERTQLARYLACAAEYEARTGFQAPPPFGAP